MVGRVAEVYAFAGVAMGGGEAVVDGAGPGHLVEERLGQIYEVYAATRECALLIFSRVPFFHKVYVWCLRADIVIQQEGFVVLGILLTILIGYLDVTTCGKVSRLPAMQTY